MSERYSASEKMLERALKTVPLGSQTFSKSITQYPHGVSPYFAAKAKGSRIWDVDGNEYIDFINGLLSITLGYCDPDVNAAVKNQLELGSIFSIASELEVDVAEKICEMVPCAEMVRFGKNGSDATAGAIRAARAITKRDHVFVCGYHGWQDWYIGSTSRNLGVPDSTQNLTHTFVYNDIESLDKLFKEFNGNVAAVIMEPSNLVDPKEGYLQEVKELTHKNGGLLIFDETITGFRFSKGGAQELYGVTPDLATFGKGLANGFPLSAVAGSAEHMKIMEEIFFSFTFGGDTISLAAAKATLTKLNSHPVLETINENGSYLKSELNSLIQRTNTEEFFDVKGHPSWSFFVLKEHEKYNLQDIKTLFMQELLANGILTFGSHNMSYAHTKDDINVLMKTYEGFINLLKGSLESGSDLKSLLKCEPLVPLFKVR